LQILWYTKNEACGKTLEDMKMANIFDVAKYILEQKGKMTTWKLQKLCYYSQAWALVWSDGTPLFEEDFQAWKNGPVCRELFNIHKGLFLITAEKLMVGRPENIKKDERDIIDTVLRGYGDMSSTELKGEIHTESPWIVARSGVSEYEHGEQVITKDSMREFYSSLDCWEEQT
jgi:uncharacterized phage-associated protein